MNLRKLKGKIVEADMTQEDLAKKLGISVQALNAKLNKRSTFTIIEVSKMIDILNIENPNAIFFGQ
ncbi:helix-turn-helix transcriptional regulator [Clostridium sediminicola]|uniref:helix-turn-helix transcriptional regulator n=1 Tax=Clostridium sediminicola TaxID=3114879 RepID=UPI0031F1DF1F